MPEKDEAVLPRHIMVRTTLGAKPQVSLLASKQQLEYQVFDDMLMVSIPETLRTTMGTQEAVVLKISR